MGKIYCLIWSKVKAMFISALEKVAHREGSATLVGAFTLTLFLCFSETAFALDPGTLPTSGKITTGKGSISQSGRSMTVKQSTEKMIVNWKTFNIGTKAKVKFKQPDSESVALNKIYDQNPSQIMGSLSANGNIFLINPSGIVFGKTSQINVGSLIASSLNIRDEDFWAGKYTFLNNGDAGNIINYGTIDAKKDGIVALIGPNVTNNGTINAEKGNVLMAAGNQITLDLEGNDLISYTVDQGAVDALAENSGYIHADGGEVVLTAEAANSLTQAVVNNSGVIQAQTLKRENGRILLLSDKNNGTTIVGGILDASAPKGGDGGFVETSGARVQVADDARVTTYSSDGTYGLWRIDPQDYNVAASGGDITGATLSTNLGSTSVELQSSGGSTVGSGNVNINDNVSWSANSTLTFTASNNVNINSNITATGDTAGLIINPNTANGSETPTGTGVYSLNNGAVITLSGLTPSLSIAGNAYTVINEANGGVTALQAMGISGYYALGSNIDATATSTWNGGLGFSPIGNDSTKFTGTFDGLNHTISNLTINRPSQNYVGLFGYIGSTSSAVRNVGLVGGSVTGYNFVGDLIGWNDGSVTNSYATGSISGNQYIGGLVGWTNGTISNSHATGNVSGNLTVGGLVGQNAAVGGTVTNSYATGSISGNQYIGGLVGWTNGTISNAYATGSVTGSNNYVGGLVGENYYDASGGTISNTYATGSVNGTSSVGGLVGRNNRASISNSYATGTVQSNGSYMAIGGLVGYNLDGTVTNSYATGAVGGFDFTGGLIGDNDGTITNSYATGAVSGRNWVGGLVGDNKAPGISNSYATGSVTSTGNYVGGLAGNNSSSISNSYTTGSVTGSGSYIGGFTGYNGGSISSSYWDPITTGTSTGIGGGTTTGADPLTTAQMMDSANFSGWTFGTAPSTGNWFLISGNTRPFLQMEYSTNITNAHQLQLMAMDLGENYTLGANIDMAELTNPSGMWGTQSATVLTGITTQFSPIGNNSTPFTGTFDGQNHTISNLAINRPLQDYVGLFGYIGTGSTVSNVGSEGGSVSGNSVVGGLVGYNDGTIVNSHTTSSVNGNYNSGGLVGFNYNIVDNSYSTGNVTGNNRVGGIAGYNYGTVKNSHATGVLSGGSYVGGLVGINAGTVDDSYATGSAGGNNNIGGLVGFNYSTVDDSYATGSVTGGNYVGGLVGYNYGTVTNTYAAGLVNNGVEAANVGGLVGYSYGSSASASFWDVETTGQTVSAVGTASDTANMKTYALTNGLYSSWDTGIWNIADGSYPSLK